MTAKVYFEQAIACNFLSEDKTAKNYAGMYMYMGTQNCHVLFKHVNLRSYISISIALLDDLSKL